jgi:hypothetical protein
MRNAESIKDRWRWISIDYKRYGPFQRMKKEEGEARRSERIGKGIQLII